MSRKLIECLNGDTVTIRSNYVPRLLADDYTDKFTYRGSEYSIGEFENTPSHYTISDNGYWHGALTETVFSAVLIHVVDQDTVIVGYAHW